MDLGLVREKQYIFRVRLIKEKIFIQFKKEWGEKRQKSQKRIQEREKEIQELRQAVDSEVEEIDWIFSDLICSIERKHSEVKELIRAQEKAEVTSLQMIRVSSLSVSLLDLKPYPASLSIHASLLSM
ncbi:hypothetical protein J4Q44_G00010950 [Coregonus suidteri]|uniref:TRIM8/14/16/25/29/45/65 coiled-coil region domain-containing protein n=1 Tax=Coregonus suidteri TaxID=861788 RepID=A0AAN8MNA9_9TELE